MTGPVLTSSPASSPASSPVFSPCGAVAADAGFNVPVTSNMLFSLCADFDAYSDAGSTPAVADDPVYQLSDQSGNSRHLSQATEAKRPLLKTSVQGGKSGLLFDAVDDYYDILTTFSVTDCTWFLVLKVPSDVTSATGGQNCLASQTDGSAGNARCSLSLGNRGLPAAEVVTQLAYTGAVDNKSYGKGSTQTVTAGTVLLTCQLNGTSELIRKNGSAQSLITVGVNGTLDSSQGAQRYNQTAWRFGAGHTGAGLLSGHLLAMIGYSSALSAGDISSVESFLNDYYTLGL